MNTIFLSAVILAVVGMSSATGVYYNYAPLAPYHSSSSVAYNSNAVKYNYGVAQTNAVVKAVVPQHVQYVVPQVQHQQVKYVVPQYHQQVKYVVPQVKYVQTQPQYKYVYQQPTYPVYAYKHAYPYYNYGNQVVSTLG